MKAFWIYLVSDPETNEPRYVGKTEDLPGRTAWHRSRPVRTGPPALIEWYADLRARDVKPAVSVLACISGENDETVTYTAAFVERHWIMEMSRKSNGKLVNIDWNKWKGQRWSNSPHARLENCIV